VRRTALAIAAVAVFVCPVAGSAQPQSFAVSLAAIETTTGPDLNGGASTDTEHAQAALTVTGNPLWAIPISKLSSTRDRPLFSASRRPRTPAAPAAPETQTVVAPLLAPETPPFTLVGTIIGGSSRIAIFFDESLKTATGVKEGESDSGWTLRSVDPRSAILDASGRTVTLNLPEPAGEEGASPRASMTPSKHRFQPDH
jgi:hypothetical protein